MESMSHVDSVDGLYREVGPQLLSFFHRRHADAATAEDLLQETFAAVIKHPQRLADADSPRAYLFGVARNLSAQAYRRRPLEALPAEIPEPAGASDDPRLESMRAAIAALPEPMREVLELRLQAELSYEEIAAALEIPVGTVRSRIHHAVRQLRQTFARGPAEFRL